MKTLKKLVLVTKWVVLVVEREFNLFTCVHPVLREEAQEIYRVGYRRLCEEARRL